MPTRTCWRLKWMALPKKNMPGASAWDFVTYGIKSGASELYKALEDKTAGRCQREYFQCPEHIAIVAPECDCKSETHAKEKERNKAKLKERYLKSKREHSMLIKNMRNILRRCHLIPGILCVYGKKCGYG